MKKYFFTLVLVFVLASTGSSQSILGFSTPGPDMDFLLQATNFGFDGEASSIIGGASPAVGIKVPITFMKLAFDPGIYGYTNLDINNGTEPNFRFGGFGGIKFYKVFIGVGTDIYKEGQGFVKLFSKKNGALILAFDLKFGNPFK